MALPERTAPEARVSSSGTGPPHTGGGGPVADSLWPHSERNVHLTTLKLPEGAGEGQEAVNLGRTGSASRFQAMPITVGRPRGRARHQ